MAVLPLTTSLLIAIALSQPRPPDDLGTFAPYWELVAVPERTASDAAAQRRLEEARARARAAFSGRGVEIARRFLTRADPGVRNEAYWFVIAAVADRETVRHLIHGMANAPQPRHGVVERDPGEVEVVLSTLLADDRFGASDEIARELAAVVAHPYAGDVALDLLGHSRSAAARAALDELARGGRAGRRPTAMGDQNDAAALREAARRELDPRAADALLMALDGLARPQRDARSLVVFDDPAPVVFPPDLRDRLLDSIVRLLSSPDDRLPGGARWRAQDTLWTVAGRDMRLALTYGDRVTPLAARVRVSASLARQDARAYGAVRGPRQAGMALAIAAAAVLLLARRPAWRRPVAAIAISGVAWGIVSYHGTGVWTLPPLPLAFATPWCIALVGTGVVFAAHFAVVPRPDAVIRFGLAPFIATVVGAIASWTMLDRGLWPPEDLGLMGVVLPFYVGIGAGLWSVALALIDAVAFARPRLIPPAADHPRGPRRPV